MQIRSHIMIEKQFELEEVCDEIRMIIMLY
jgi:hypothetical protein